MASIVRRVRKDGKPSYHVKYRDGSGTVRWEHVPGDKRTAQRHARNVEEKLDQTGGRWTRPEPMKVGEYSDKWLEEYAAHAVSPRVYENYRRTFRLVLKPAYENTELGALTYTHMKSLVSEMRKAGKADNTIRNNMIPIREMLGHAVKDGLIPSNPATALDIAGGKRRKITPPKPDEVASLIKHTREEAREAITVATVTGLRRGELFALRWEDVDFAKRTIRVHATNHAGHVTEQTKTEAGERFVPLFESARKVLAARKLRTTFNLPKDFVFGTSVGTPADPGNFVRREFKPALERAKLPSFRFHDLRHFAVSSLIAQGADIKLLQAIAGHASATVTLDTYGHLMTERVSEAARLYDPMPEAKPLRKVDER